MSLHGKRKEIYKYEAPWTVYAMNWSVRPDKRFRLALGSFVEEYNNKVGRAAGSSVVPVLASDLTSFLPGQLQMFRLGSNAQTCKTYKRV